MLFSPFINAFETLSASDLENLRTVSEGWYIEYKRDISKSSDIAKSISAFANTYGGWLFYGITEQSKDNPVAGTFIGIDVAETDTAIQRIRQSVAQHMNPPAHFDTKVVLGDGILLPVGRIILCVRVPQSLLTPHVHRSGRIYRRVADGSEPQPENDRYLLQKLFSRSKKIRDEYRKWIKKDPEFSKSEDELPYLRIFFVADIWDQEEIWFHDDTKKLKAIFSNDKGVVTSIPLDSFYSSSKGYVARKVGTSDPHGLGITWFLNHSLVSEVIVPLPAYFVNNIDQLDYQLGGYEQSTRFMQILSEKNYNKPRIVDLNILFNLLIAVVEKQREILGLAGWKKPYYVKTKLINVWRTVPFLDEAITIEEFASAGLPVCLSTTMVTSPGTDPESFDKIGLFVETTDESAQIILQALGIFIPIARAWGLTMDFSENLDPPYFSRLHSAGVRALEVQNRKNR